MAYFPHMKVTDLIEAHASRVSPPATWQDSDDLLPPKFVRDTETGVVMHHCLRDLCIQLRKAFRGIKFYVGRDCRGQWHNNTHIVNELWACFDGDLYAPFRIGYKVYGREDENTFSIKARTVKNERYSTNSEGYCMVRTTDLSKAVRNAKKYMRPYSSLEVAGMSADAYVSHARSQVREAYHAYNDVKHRMFKDMSKLVAELRALLNNGHEFQDPTFGADAAEFVVAYDAKDVVDTVQVNAHFVTVSTLCGEQKFEVLTVPYVDRQVPNIRSSEKHEYDASTLPEDIAHKLAALSIVTDGTYVQGLGLRISETTYWVDA